MVLCVGLKFRLVVLNNTVFDICYEANGNIRTSECVRQVMVAVVMCLIFFQK